MRREKFKKIDIYTSMRHDGAVDNTLNDHIYTYHLDARASLGIRLKGKNRKTIEANDSRVRNANQISPSETCRKQELLSRNILRAFTFSFSLHPTKTRLSRMSSHYGGLHITTLP